MAGCATRRGAARRAAVRRRAPGPGPRSTAPPLQCLCETRTSKARATRNSYRNTLLLCFCCRKTTYSYRNDGKTEKTDVSVPVVAEQRAREDQSRPPRPEGDRGGQEGGRTLAFHGRQDHVGREGGCGQGAVRTRPGVL